MVYTTSTKFIQTYGKTHTWGLKPLDDINGNSVDFTTVNIADEVWLVDAVSRANSTVEVLTHNAAPSPYLEQQALWLSNYYLHFNKLTNEMMEQYSDIVVSLREYGVGNITDGVTSDSTKAILFAAFPRGGHGLF
jgi:phage gp36-like protein